MWSVYNDISTTTFNSLAQVKQDIIKKKMEQQYPISVILCTCTNDVICLRFVFSRDSFIVEPLDVHSTYKCVFFALFYFVFVLITL